MGRKLFFVSNRLPVTLEKKRGSINYKQSIGGLSTGLGSFYRSFNSVWLGWCGIPKENLTAEEKDAVQTTLMNDYRNIPVFLTRSDIKRFYYGFCNKTIWPLFHYFSENTIYDEDLWNTYVRVNEKFCDAVVENAEESDLIWIHDYQLLLLPRFVREKLPQAQIGFFLHIPFPSFEIFRLLPWAGELLEGILGADLIGFHTYDYVRHFLSSVRRLLGYEHTMGQIFAGKRIVQADVFPMGIDYERYAGAHSDNKVQKEITKIKKQIGERKIILSVDRLDYTKGILQRLKSFDYFLKKYPEFHDKVTLILVAVPSRTNVEAYASLKSDLDEIIGGINGRYGSIGWVPVWYLYRGLPFHVLTALYILADVALVTPIRDGMNLVAKEYIATRGDRGGTLILSEMTGAVHEMSESLVVNPNNIEQVAEALKRAVEMPFDEQIKLNAPIQARLQRYNVERWAHDFVDRLNMVYEHQKRLYERRLTDSMKETILQAYENANDRLLLFDYDGTLTPFSTKPENAIPDDEIIDLIRILSESERNEVVIISGRDRDTLYQWFGNLRVGLVAEHGVWVQERMSDWNEIESLRDDWKEEVRPVFELYQDRTPGSFIEEKQYSFVWHYRMSDPDLGAVRVNELKETLLKLTENLDLGILEGNKVIEVKPSNISKGRAALHWLRKKKWDFILALGDDVTDEDTFAVLPQYAYSIKVGLGITQASFNVLDVNEVRMLLSKLISA